MTNQKGFSWLGTLITVTIIAILTIVIVKKYQILNTNRQMQTQQTLQQLQSAVQDIQKTTADHALEQPTI